MVNGHGKADPKSFFAAQKAPTPAALWRAVVSEVQAGLPPAEDERAAYLAKWDAEIGHHVSDAHRWAERTWWARVVHHKPQDRWAAQGGGTFVFKGIRQEVDPLWPLARALSVDFDEGFSAQDLAGLAALPLGKITRLETRVALTPETLGAALEGPHAQAITHFVSTLGPMDSAFLSDCTHFDFWRRLEGLSLSHSRLDDAALEQLLDLLDGGQLKHLHLSNQALGPQAGQIFARWAGLEGLEFLGLESTNFNDQGIETLLAEGKTSALRALLLKDSLFGPMGFTARTGRALGQAPGLSTLRVLHIEGSTLGGEGAAALLKNPQLSGLKTLVIRSSGLGDDGLLAIAAAKHLRCLKRLDLKHNGRVSESTRAMLVAAAHLADTQVRLP